ncbi:MAG: hypothetical protein IIT57_14655, partial [Treponema sp.]|nr:hypothetical protein [Treponema sp.]
WNMDNDNKINSLAAEKNLGTSLDTSLGTSLDLIETKSAQKEKNLVPAEKAESVPSKIERELMLFLGDELAPLRRTKKVDVYDLETEYQKTGKNIRWSVWITLAATALAVILVTVFTVKGLSKSNEKIEINFSSFANLGLQDLFSQLQKTQENYDEATKRRSELKGNLEARLNAAKLAMDNDLEVLADSTLPDDVKKEKRAKIREDYNAEVLAAHTEFDAPLLAAETEVKQYEEQLKNFDSENVARAQKYEQQMDSERQIYELEKSRTTKNFQDKLDQAAKELQETRQKSIEDRRKATREIASRYEGELASLDPTIKDSKVNKIISDAESKLGPSIFDANAFIKLAGDTSQEFSASLKQAQADYENLFALYQQASSIPYKNSMKALVPAERKLSYNIIAALTSSASSEIKAKNSELEKLNEQIASLTRDMEDKKKEVEALSQQFDHEKQKATNLEYQASQSAALQQKIEESQQQSASLEKQLAEASAKSSRLEQRIAELEQKLSSAESSLSARENQQTEETPSQQGTASASQQAELEEAKRINEEAQRELEKMQSQLKTVKNQRDYAVNSSLAFKAILNSSVIADNIAGFVVGPTGQSGAPVFIRNAYKGRVSGDGSTRVKVSSGSSIIATGSLREADGDFYLIPDEGSATLSSGNTIELAQ